MEYRTVKSPIVVRLPEDVSLKDIDKMKVEFETEGQVFGDTLGYHQKFVRVPVPRIVRVRSFCTERGVVEGYMSLTRIRVVDEYGNEKLIRVNPPESFFLFKGRYRPVVRKRWAVSRKTAKRIAKYLTEVLGWDRERVKEYLEGLLKEKTRDEIELVKGSIKIYLAYWGERRPQAQAHTSCCGQREVIWQGSHPCQACLVREEKEGKRQGSRLPTP